MTSVLAVPAAPAFTTERNHPLPARAIVLAALLGMHVLLALPTVGASRTLPDPLSIGCLHQPDLGSSECFLQPGLHSSDCLLQPATCYVSDEASSVVETVMRCRRESGGWPKNEDAFGHEGCDSLPGYGKRVCLDMYFNNEWRERKDGTRERYHYTWDDTTNSGFSQLGTIIDRLGASRSALSSAPTPETLAGCDVYIIVDPDLPKESPDPHMMDSASARAIGAWVAAGGVLVLMANDSGNAEFDHFNTLAREFGITFNRDSYHKVVGKEYETGATSPLPDHEAFNGVRKIFTKEVSTLRLAAPAKAILTEGDRVLMAESRIGSGLVFAVGDPWLYNEYMDHRRLPADFENDRAAAALFRWLLRHAR